MTRRIQAVLFDVIETLFGLEPVRRKLTGAVSGPDLVTVVDALLALE